MYKVLHYFTDLQDHNHAYHPGDEFPRKGVEVTAERLKELSSGNNRRGKALIEGTEEPKEKPKEPVENFINPPEEPEANEQPAEEKSEPVKPKRGRKKKD